MTNWRHCFTMYQEKRTCRGSAPSFTPSLAMIPCLFSLYQTSPIETSYLQIRYPYLISEIIFSLGSADYLPRWGSSQKLRPRWGFSSVPLQNSCEGHRQVLRCLANSLNHNLFSPIFHHFSSRHGYIRRP